MNTHNNHSFVGRLFRLFPPPRLLAMPASGIDISDQSLRYLELEKTKQGLHIKRYGSQGFPEGLVVEGKIENTAGLIVELQKLKEETGIDFVRVSLPEEQAYLFQTVVPVLDEKQNLRSMIEFQLEEHVPIPSEGAVFDYEIIKRLENGEIEVNVAVYGTDVIAAYLEVLKGARLTPLSFEVESQAIARAVLPQRDMGTYMLVDFGRTRTGIGIMSGGILQYTSTIAVGGVALTSAIQKYFKVTQKEADKIKNEKGFAHYRQNAELFETLMSTVSALKDEIYKRYTYWNTRVNHRGENPEKIEKIFLCGGSSNLAGLPDYLMSGIQVPVVVSNVWSNVFSFEDAIPPVNRTASLAYATVIGLALRQFE